MIINNLHILFNHYFIKFQYFLSIDSFHSLNQLIVFLLHLIIFNIYSFQILSVLSQNLLYLITFLNLLFDFKWIYCLYADVFFRNNFKVFESARCLLWILDGWYQKEKLLKKLFLWKLLAHWRCFFTKFLQRTLFIILSI